MNIFISGTSRGIGKAIAQHYAKDSENKVFGISRSSSDLEISHAQLDLSETENIEKTIKDLLKDIDQLDIVFLNAGVLGKLQTMHEADLNDLKNTMDINLWAQKVLLDTLLLKNPKLVIAISSGAAVNGNMGWSGYSLSKAALNMLVQLYASEFQATKFIALAPGLVDTQMQDTISNTSAEKFPSLERLHQARGTEQMPSPEKFVENFIAKYQQITSIESGSFIDIRKI